MCRYYHIEFSKEATAISITHGINLSFPSHPRDTAAGEGFQPYAYYNSLSIMLAL